MSKIAMIILVLTRDWFATSSIRHRPLANAACLVADGISISPPLHPRAEATGFSGDSDNIEIDTPDQSKTRVWVEM